MGLSHMNTYSYLGIVKNLMTMILPWPRVRGSKVVGSSMEQLTLTGSKIVSVTILLDLYCSLLFAKPLLRGLGGVLDLGMVKNEFDSVFDRGL